MNYSLQSERILKILLALCLLSIPLGLMLFFTQPPPVHAAGAWYVTTSGSDSNDCLGPATGCATINGAIAKVSSSETVFVATGTYTGTGTEVVLVNKSVTLSGGWDSSFTTQSGMSTVDGQNARRGVTANSNLVANVDRFVVQNGYGTDFAGGIVNGAALTLTNSVVSNNVGVWPNGGGIYNYGALTVISTSIRNNQFGEACCTGGGGGAGIHNGYGNLVLNNSAVFSNTIVGGFSGSGIYHSVGSLVVNNSTVSSNGGGSGEGILSYGAITVTNSTISHNQGVGLSSTGTLKLQNTILSNNGFADCAGPGGLVSQGYNLIKQDINCAGSYDLTNVDPLIGPLQDNGGPTFTRAIPFSSPAVNHGNPSGCADNLGNPLGADQRGFPRVGRCDIGAYEYQGIIYQVFLPLISRACPDFFDDFSNPASGWPIIDDSYLHTEYLSGEYRMLSKQSGFIFRVKAPTSDRQNYSVEADARWVGTPGSSYGLIFAVTSGFNQYYLFDMNTDYQQYRVLRRDPGPVYTTIVPVTSSSAIASGNGTNHLKAIRNGSQHTVAVNGTTLTTFADSAISGLTGTGVATIPYSNIPTSDARFDNYSLLCQLGGGNAPTQLNGPSLLSPDGFRENAPSKLQWPKR